MSPPGAPRPPRKAATDVPRDENDSHSSRRGWVVFGAHNRWECCRRSHQSFPCRKCCRCWQRSVCEHPAFADWEAA